MPKKNPKPSPPDKSHPGRKGLEVGQLEEQEAPEVDPIEALRAFMQVDPEKIESPKTDAKEAPSKKK